MHGTPGTLIDSLVDELLAQGGSQEQAETMRALLRHGPLRVVARKIGIGPRAARKIQAGASVALRRRVVARWSGPRFRRDLEAVVEARIWEENHDTGVHRWRRPTIFAETVQGFRRSA